MRAFRRLIITALMAGTLSGLVWFGLQYFAVIPLIETAEKYETMASHDHEDHGTRLRRNSLTAVTTVLTAIGFAAMLFGVVSLTGQRLDVKSGALWGSPRLFASALLPLWDCRPSHRVRRQPIWRAGNCGGWGLWLRPGLYCIA